MDRKGIFKHKGDEMHREENQTRLKRYYAFLLYNNHHIHTQSGHYVEICLHCRQTTRGCSRDLGLR